MLWSPKKHLKSIPDISREKNLAHPAREIVSGFCSSEAIGSCRISSSMSSDANDDCTFRRSVASCTPCQAQIAPVAANLIHHLTQYNPLLNP